MEARFFSSSGLIYSSPLAPAQNIILAVLRSPYREARRGGPDAVTGDADDSALIDVASANKADISRVSSFTSMWRFTFGAA